MSEEVESSWECTHCDISVPSEKNRCTGCLRWRPGAQRPTTSLRMSMKRKPEDGEDDKGDDKPAKNRRSTRVKSSAMAQKNPDTDEEEELAAVAKDKKATKKKKKSSVVAKGKGKGKLKKSDEDSYSEDSADDWDDDDDVNGKVTNRQKKRDAKKGTVFEPDGGGYYYGGEGKKSNIPELMDNLQQSYSKGIITVLGESSTSLDRASIESAMKEVSIAYHFICMYYYQLIVQQYSHIILLCIVGWL